MPFASAKRGLVSATGGFTVTRRCLGHGVGTCIVHATSISSFAERPLLRAEAVAQSRGFCLTGLREFGDAPKSH